MDITQIIWDSYMASPFPSKHGSRQAKLID